MKKRPDPKSFSDDQLVERWKSWLEHTKNEAYQFYSFRFKAENVNKMFVENKALQTEGGGSLYDWILKLHTTYCLTSIRRELEGGTHQNLVSFLHEVENFSERVFTRKRFVGMYGETHLQFGAADRDFDGITGAACNWPRTSADDDFISKDSIVAARENLSKFAQPVLDYMNWQVAHRTDATARDVTWGDLNRTMNRIFDTYARYYFLLTGKVYTSRYPEPQYNWLHPFTIPWTTETFVPWRKPDEPEGV